MGYELLEYLADLLTEAGIPAGEEYPAGERVEIHSPVAAVGLRELDAAAGEARFHVRILSPRILGGWCCQLRSARAAEALQAAGLDCQIDEMEYLGGSDCFGITLTASMPVVRTEVGWQAGHRWRVFCGETEQEGVSSFRAVRDLGRKMVGAMAYNGPVAITTGSGGWNLELRQRGTLEPEAPEEPFVLTVQDGQTIFRYTGCGWNKTELCYTQGGLELIRRGFALNREVEADG